MDTLILSKTKIFTAPLDELKQTVLSHPVLHHEYWQRIAESCDPEQALRSFFGQYSYYNECFTDLLCILKDRLPSGNVRDTLEQHLQEELGQPAQNISSETDLQVFPSHVELYQEFMRLIGLNPQQLPPLSAAMFTWLDSLAELCRHRPILQAIGAIGYGTELIVPAFYQSVLNQVESIFGKKTANNRFLNLHIQVDKEHAELFINIAKNEIKTEKDFRDLQQGALTALTLRQNFLSNLSQQLPNNVNTGER